MASDAPGEQVDDRCDPTRRTPPKREITSNKPKSQAKKIKIQDPLRRTLTPGFDIAFRDADYTKSDPPLGSIGPLDD